MKRKEGRHHDARYDYLDRFHSLVSWRVRQRRERNGRGNGRPAIVAGFMDMSEAVPSSCLVTCIVAGYVAWMYRRSCRMASVWPMLLGCLPGVLAGVWVLKFVPGTWLQAGLGSLLLVYMLWQYLYIPSRST